MNVLLLSPGFPSELGWFAEALAHQGARVFGVGEQSRDSFEPRVQSALTAYLRVKSLFDEDAVVREVAGEARRNGVRFARVECLWEPFVILAARLREALDVPGMRVETVLPFRDKELMKRKLDAAGVRTPRHASATSAAEVRTAAERIGYPLIVKPIAGAGSADTYRVDDAGELERILQLVRHVPEVSVEEFIDGHEFTFDTICVDGKPAYFNICWYRPRPLIAKSNEWVSPTTVALRDVQAPHLKPGVELGLQVLSALEFESGFTHMEWFLSPEGEAVFGEIGARVAGARTADVMNVASDTDVYATWAEAVLHGRVSRPLERKYNAASIFKRAQGQGRIERVEGLESWLAKFGPHVAMLELLPIGAPRRNWKQVLISDGMAIVRHPDLDACCEIADRFGTDVQMFAH